AVSAVGARATPSSPGPAAPVERADVTVAPAAPAHRASIVKAAIDRAGVLISGLERFRAGDEPSACQTGHVIEAPAVLAEAHPEEDEGQRSHQPCGYREGIPQVIRVPEDVIGEERRQDGSARDPDDADGEEKQRPELAAQSVG